MAEPFDERRKTARKPGEGLVVIIAGKTLPILDITIYGVSFQGTGYKEDEEVSLKIAKLEDANDSVDVKFRVKSNDGTIVRGKFYPKISIMRYIINHLSDISGVKSQYFK